MAFIIAETADSLGIDYLDSQLVATTGSMPPTSAMDDLHAAFSATLTENVGEIWFEVETGPPENAAQWVWGLLALSGLIALASSAVAIGLACFDGRQDDATLAAPVWAHTSVPRWGCYRHSPSAQMPARRSRPPWLPFRFAVVALPLLIATGSWLFTRRPKVQTRRMSIA